MFFTCYTSFASNSGLFQRSMLTARVAKTLRSCRRRLLAGTHPIRCFPPHHTISSTFISVRFFKKRLQKCGREFPFLFLNYNDRRLTEILALSRGPYDPLKVDVWSLGATTWELAHGDPPFSDVQDTRLIVGHQLPPVREPETLSRSFHDFLHLCSQPVASRPDPDELLNVRATPPFFFFQLTPPPISGLFYTDCLPSLGDCSAAGPV